MKFIETLTADLWILDAILTGGDSRSGRGDPDKLVDGDWLIGGREFYLSDGGYSRVCVDYESRTVFLTGNSTDRARSNWDKPGAKSVRLRIGDLIRKYYDSNGAVE